MVRKNYKTTFRKGRITQAWNLLNLYNLKELKSQPTVNRSFFQQKWAAKAITRTYHGKQLGEKKWQLLFSRHIPAVVEMDPAQLARNDGSRHSAGRGSGLIAQKSDSDREKRPPRNTPYMAMTYWPLERRLDTAIFRAMFASSVRMARQYVVHGHVKVNGKRMRYPGYLLNPGDMFSVDPELVMLGVGLRDTRSNKQYLHDEVPKYSEDQEEYESERKARWEKIKQQQTANVSQDADVTDATEQAEVAETSTDSEASASAAQRVAASGEARGVGTSGEAEAVETKAEAEAEVVKTKAEAEVVETSVGADVLDTSAGSNEAVSKTGVEEVPSSKKVGEAQTSTADQSDASKLTTKASQIKVKNPRKTLKRLDEMITAITKRGVRKGNVFRGRQKHRLYRLRKLRKEIREALEAPVGEAKVNSVEMFHRFSGLAPRRPKSDPIRIHMAKSRLHRKEADGKAPPLTHMQLLKTWPNVRQQDKPYLTPWLPRHWMGPFAFIPRYLEVNQNVCSAVYLRHPVARSGESEVPSPFHVNSNLLSYQWYLRRR